VAPSPTDESCRQPSGGRAEAVDDLEEQLDGEADEADRRGDHGDRYEDQHWKEPHHVSSILEGTGGIFPVPVPSNQPEGPHRRFNVGVRRFALPLLALVLTASASGATARPALLQVSLQPLTVQGVRFRVNERVTLLLASEGVASKRVVRAGARGRFTVRYALRVDRCTSYALQAIGSRGSRATLQRDVVDCTEP
jgi:hypothetical protein